MSMEATALQTGCYFMKQPLSFPWELFDSNFGIDDLEFYIEIVKVHDCELKE